MSAQAVAELHVGSFSPAARELLALMFRKGEQPRVLTTLHLLRALAHAPELWPQSYTMVRHALKDERIGDQAALEPRNDEVVFEGVHMSKVLSAVFEAAVRIARMAHEESVPPAAMLWALTQPVGSDAALYLRAALQSVDPWPGVGERCMELLGLAEGNGEAAPVFALHERDERLVALVYLLLRDEVSFGKIMKHVQALEQKDGKTFTFTNAHGEALARSIVGRLRA